MLVTLDAEVGQTQRQKAVVEHSALTHSTRLLIRCIRKYFFTVAGWAIVHDIRIFMHDTLKAATATFGT